MHARSSVVLLSLSLIATSLGGLAAGSPDQATLAGVDRLAEGVGLVGEETQRQLALLDAPTPTAPAGPSHDRPSQALQALAEAHGVQPDPEQRASIDALDDLPAGVQADLTAWIEAYRALERASAEAFGDVKAEPLTASADSLAGVSGEPEAFEAAHVDPVPALAARQSLLDATVDLAAALEAAPDGALEDQHVHLPPVASLDLEGRDDTYDEDLLLVWDEGGDDRYLNNAGGSGGFVAGAAGVLVDRSGQDVYGEPLDAELDRRSGINGGGLTGTGVLVDDGGDDEYYGGDDAVNGAGFAGAGLLLDTAGDDTYDAAGWGVNGGGYIAGVGLLVDGAGDDEYEGSHAAVNGGGTSGIGALHDRAGDDRYTATAHAVNGGGSGGAGRLLDGGGHDVYMDLEGGSGVDKTVVPKEDTGAQIDD